MAIKCDAVGSMDLKAAWEYQGVTSMINGDGFDSQIFTIITGPEEKGYTAHATYLCQSPVLERMCYGQFQESQTFEIRLPEDEPQAIRALIQYLYTGRFLDYGTMESGNGSAGAATQLAELYATADKYQLQDLKALVAKNLDTVIDVEERPIDFLLIMRATYTSIPDWDKARRKHFKNLATQLPKPNFMAKPMREVFDECISGGGILATDLVSALCLDYHQQLRSLYSNPKRMLSDALDLICRSGGDIDEFAVELAGLLDEKRWGK
ncbi:MAG: hypothetical protein Q9199_001771 [Rusavskia elegans]